jgi:glyceraldehyde 3-phosphate dehydrogenase
VAKETSYEEIMAVLKKASETTWKVFRIYWRFSCSQDFVGDSRTSTLINAGIGLNSTSLKLFLVW